MINALYIIGFSLDLIEVKNECSDDCILFAFQGASDTWNLPVSFIGVILLPILGNATEHESAIMFSMNDKLVSGVLSVLLCMHLLFDSVETKLLPWAGHHNWSCDRVIYSDINVCSMALKPVSFVIVDLWKHLKS